MSVTVAITCWPSHPARVAYLRRTIETLQANLCGGEFRWLVSAETEQADDAPWAGEALVECCDALGVPLRWRQGPASLPAHLNELYAAAFAETSCVLYVQDDWELMRPLDLSGPVGLLIDDPFVAGIRFWAKTGYRNEVQGDYRLANLKYDWCYADNPALWHRRWWEKAGPFPTEGAFGTHEHLVSKRMLGTGLKILVPHPVVKEPDSYFRHMGEITSVPNDARWADAPKRSDPALWT